MPSIRVMCVDDHAIVREGVAAIVTREDGMEVVGLAGGVREAVDVYRRERPDVTLMDLSLGEASGVEGIRRIRGLAPEAKILVLTVHHGDEDIYRALQAGAVGYLLKEGLSSELVRAIRVAYSGTGLVMRSDLKRRLEKTLAGPHLTQRETEVIQLVASGLRNKELAAVLGISEETVQSHLRNIYSKLDVTDRTAAAHVALEKGIIRID